MDLISSSLNSCIELPNPHCDGIWRFGLWEIIGLDEIMRWE